ncbi:TOBE domain-containing protein [Helicobacter mesocricetorum]|uniref:TOBE domain-containing protein n=1 Tax=Helicobacter mesocricetorum TaxID=87012 RepID=UPI000CF184F2|nr:TOBE domain-containing protein [Helicobacter mesocricetorum]
MEIQGRIWIKEKGKNFLGYGKIELLERIAKSGSISKAAKEMRMSYKAAWDCVDAMNKLSKEPLVVTIKGGKNGGGAQITQKGQEMIEVFHQIRENHERVLRLFEGDLHSWEVFLEGKGKILDALKGVTMRTSARNQIYGEIVAIKEDAVNAEVVLKLKEGVMLTSSITLHSLKQLGLEVGMQCCALIKANWMVVFKEEPKQSSLQNLLGGIIESIQEGDTNSEIEINSNGVPLYAIITKELKDDLCLKNGEKVWFGFKANNVILGI